MPAALIATFSQTGATKRYASHIADGLREAGWRVDHHAITLSHPPDATAYDVIGIASPTYFYRPPFIVTDFVNALPDLSRKATFVCVTHGTARGACGNRLRTQLKAKGARDLGYFTGYGADYWPGYMERGYLFSADSPGDADLAEATVFGTHLAQRYHDQNSGIEPYDGSTPFVYALERFFVMRPFARMFFSRTFAASDHCVGCGACVAKCPMGNIEMGSFHKPVFHNNCMLCMSCEMVCPVGAIRSAVDWPIFAPFMRYNVRRASQHYAFARVAYRNGKIKRL